MLGNVVRILGYGGGYNSSTRQRGVSIMGSVDFICYSFLYAITGTI